MAKNLKYLQISDKLKRQIASGSFHSGAHLPPCRELALSFKVSYMTMTNALRLLEEDGFISRRHGSGNFVNGAEKRTVPKNQEKTGFIMPVRGEFFQNFFSVAMTELERHNVLSIPLTDTSALERMSGGDCSGRIRKYASSGFSSLVIDGTRHFPFNALKETENMLHQLNFVMHYDSDLDFPDANIILPDYRKAGYKAAMHLLENGWEKIGFVTFEEMDEVRRRFNGARKCAYDTLVLDGIEDAFIKREMDFMSSCRVFRDNSGEIRPAIADFISPGITAFILMGDQRHAHIMKIASEMGLSIPGDVGCVGFYNTSRAECWGLSSVSICEEKIAEITAEAVISGWKGRRIMTECKLIKRESSVRVK
ncbi:MAG: hypothetical protein A2017_13630 [Lentisphaerae bacterium GWF2_44_16]|nr:MAG: hypothetical protein A2017_13630 [Lentisphaerae bacterium GWF2_44_16]